MGFFDVNVKGVEVKQVYVGVGLDKASTLMAQKRHAVGGMDLDPAGHNAFAHRSALRANVHRMDDGAGNALAEFVEKDSALAFAGEGALIAHAAGFYDAGGSP